ncbi:hypothetical protein QTP88_000274 [Uroleucon formosanum]
MCFGWYSPMSVVGDRNRDIVFDPPAALRVRSSRPQGAPHTPSPFQGSCRTDFALAPTYDHRTLYQKVSKASPHRSTTIIGVIALSLDVSENKNKEKNVIICAMTANLH